MKWLLSLLLAVELPAANWVVSPAGNGDGTTNTPGALLTAMAHTGWAASIAAGDTVYLRAGQYNNGTNRASMLFSGSAGNLVTWRSYPGERAILNFPTGFGANDYHRFQDLECIATNKAAWGENPGYFDASTATHNEWINLIIHDTPGLWTGTAGGSVIRGCIIWNVGTTYREHVVYPYVTNFTGNIVGWCGGNVFELGAAASQVTSNIIFGTGITVNAGATAILMTQSPNGLIAHNRIYETLGNARGVQNQSAPGVVTNNIVSAGDPLRLFSSGEAFTVTGNTIRGGGVPHTVVLRRQAVAGEESWTVNGNAYYSEGINLFFEDETDNLISFTQWKSDNAGYDTTSTSANATLPPDSVTVFSNADEPKRAHVAIYNWTGAHNISVNLSGVLESGDFYRIYSAQNYGAGPILNGQFTGASISVPMTNLTVAPILYATGLTQPSATSPTFGAFVVAGFRRTLNVTTVNVGQ